MHDGMVRYANADRLASRVEEAPRDRTGRPQHEDIRSGCIGSQQPVLPVLDDGKAGDLRQVSADDGEEVSLASLAQGLDALHGGLGPERTAKGIAGVRRISD